MEAELALNQENEVLKRDTKEIYRLFKLLLLTKKIKKMLIYYIIMILLFIVKW